MYQNNQEKDNGQAMPIGLGFGLAMNQEAMNQFAGMSEEEKKQVIETARGVESKEEMQNLIQSLAELDKNTHFS